MLRIFLVIFLLFSNVAFATEYDIRNVRPFIKSGQQIKEVERKRNEIPNYRGYKGDFSQRFYKKQNNTNHFYGALKANFALGVSAGDNADYVLEYTDAGLVRQTETGMSENDVGGEFGFGLAIGYQKQYSRIEVEFGYNGFGLDQVKDPSSGSNILLTEEDDETGLTNLNLSLNYIFTLNKKDGNVIPFFGAGYGFGVTKGNESFGGASPFYRLIGGISYKISDSIQLSLEYNYLSFDEVEYEMSLVDSATQTAQAVTFTHPLSASMVVLGYKIKFNNELVDKGRSGIRRR